MTAVETEGSQPGSFLRGVTDNLPFIPGNLLWGAIFGAAATVAGLAPGAAALFSAVVYSGTAQLAVIKIVAFPLTTIFVTSLLLSLRFLPMSVALNHRLRLSHWRRLFLSAVLVDSSFVMMTRHRHDRLGRYLVGMGLCNYASWIVGTAAGALLGPTLPHSWAPVVEALTIVIFVVLTVEPCDNRRTVAAAVAGAGAALASVLVVGSGPAVAVGAVVGSAALVLSDRRRT